MICQFPECEKDAVLRVEIENLRFCKEAWGWDGDPSVSRGYYCTEHYRVRVRDLVLVMDVDWAELARKREAAND